MDKPGSIKPLISQGWLRALLFIIALGIAAAIFLGIYLITAMKGNPDSQGVDSLLKGNSFFVTAVIIFVLSLALTYVFRRWVDRKSFISLGLDFKGHGADAVTGAMLATFIVCASSLLLKITGHLNGWIYYLMARRCFWLLGVLALFLFMKN